MLVVMDSEWWGGLAPWAGVEHGLGVCYSISPGRLTVLVAAWSASKKVDCTAFRDGLRQAMLDVAELAGITVAQ